MKTKVRILSEIKDDYDWRKLEAVEHKITDYLINEYGIPLEVKGDVLSGDISMDSAVNLLQIISLPNSECDIMDRIEELNDGTVKFGGVSFEN